MPSDEQIIAAAMRIKEWGWIGDDVIDGWTGGDNDVIFTVARPKGKEKYDGAVLSTAATTLVRLTRSQAERVYRIAEASGKGATGDGG